MRYTNTLSREPGTPKTGAHLKGRQQMKPIQHVEQVPCPAREEGNHELVNSPRLVTTCQWCHETWGALDTELNQRSN